MPTRFFVPLVILGLVGFRGLGAPVFSSGSSASVAEGTPVSTVIYTAVATEAGKTITYSLNGTDAAAFTINAATGALNFKNVPDYETKSVYSINIGASDGTVSSFLGVTINVTDLPPVITSPTTANVNEGVPAGTVVYTAIAADPVGGTVTYSLSGTDAASFTINPTTGVVTINAMPNFESKASYSFTVKASDPSGEFNTQVVTLSINDLPPVITSSSNGSITEGAAAGTTVYIATATDPGGGTLTYSLSGTDASAFTINSSTGVVTINTVPDYETKSSYSIHVNVSDGTLSTGLAVTINVTDLPPVITSPSTASVNNSASAGATVYTAVAADPAGGAVFYALTGVDAAAFTINSATGVVTINSVPHYLTKSSYSITVKASDASGAFNTLGVTITVNPSINASPPKLIGSSFSGNSGFTFQFTNVTGASFTALASTNLTLPLSNWTVLGPIAEGPIGHYQFSDPQATNNAHRFYGVRSP